MLRPSELRPERAFAHPFFWGALALLVVNDHVLKRMVPGVLTGKLSDLAGMVVAPVVLAAALRVRSRRALTLAFAAVGLGFALVKVAAPAAHLVERLGAAMGIPWRIWVDPGDLVALPMLLVAWHLFAPGMARSMDGLARRRRSEQASRWGLALGAVACLASAVPPRPATAPGTIVTRAWGGEPLFAIDTVSGERVRRLAFDEAGAQVVADGVVYTVRGRSLHGHRLDDGAEVLHHVSEDATFHELALADEHRIYLLAAPSFGYDDERAIAIDRAGTIAWSQALPSRLGRRSPELSPLLANGQLVVAAGEHVIAFDAARGTRLWTHRTDGGVRTLAATAHGVFALRTDDVIVAIDAAKGSRQWTLPVKTAESDWYGGRRLAASRDALVTWQDERLVAIDPATRGTRWIGPVADEAVVGAEVAFVRLGEERYGLVDLTGGTLRWSRELDHDIRTPPVVMEQDGIVLIRPRDDELFAYELADGRLRWHFDLDDGAPILPDDD